MSIFALHVCHRIQSLQMSAGSHAAYQQVPVAATVQFISIDLCTDRLGREDAAVAASCSCPLVSTQTKTQSNSHVAHISQMRTNQTVQNFQMTCCADKLVETGCKREPDDLWRHFTPIQMLDRIPSSCVVLGCRSGRSHEGDQGVSTQQPRHCSCHGLQ